MPSSMQSKAKPFKLPGRIEVIMADPNIYKQALEEISEINDISLVDCEEGLTKLLYELNDRFLEIQSIARAALGTAKREELIFDQTADQTPNQFDPFPDEVEKCPECGQSMVLRHGKRGDFYGCSGYPNCRHTRNIDVDEAYSPAVHKADWILCTQVIGNEYNYLKIDKNGDLNDQMETDEIFTDPMMCWR